VGSHTLKFGSPGSYLVESPLTAQS